MLADLNRVNSSLTRSQYHDLQKAVKSQEENNDDTSKMYLNSS